MAFGLRQPAVVGEFRDDTSDAVAERRGEFIEACARIFDRVVKHSGAQDSNVVHARQTAQVLGDAERMHDVVHFAAGLGAFLAAVLVAGEGDSFGIEGVVQGEDLKSQILER